MWEAFARELEKLAGDGPAMGAPRALSPPPVPKAKATKPPALAMATPPKAPTIGSNLQKTATFTKLAVLGRVAAAIGRGERKLRNIKQIGLGVPLAAGVGGIYLAHKASQPGRTKKKKQRARQPEYALPELAEF